MLDGRVKPLVLALKKWGKASSVIDSKNNRLASECILLKSFTKFFIFMVMINILNSKPTRNLSKLNPSGESHATHGNW